MWANMKNHRIHVTIRRQGEPIFDSAEYKTENCDSLDDLLAEAAEYIATTITDDQENSDENDESN